MLRHGATALNNFLKLQPIVSIYEKQRTNQRSEPVTFLCAVTFSASYLLSVLPSACLGAFWVAMTVDHNHYFPYSHPPVSFFGGLTVLAVGFWGRMKLLEKDTLDVVVKWW